MNETESLSTRIKISVFFIVLFISLFFIPAKWLGISDENKTKLNSSSLNNQRLEILSSQTLTEKINDDTDNDGLLNWQEALWGTDPNNPDTDTDGTPDNEEVQNGRDPKKSGPDDKLINFTDSKDPDTVALIDKLNDPNNLTSRLAKNTLSISSILDQQKITDPAIQQAVQQGLVEDIKPLVQPKTYTLSDIKIDNDSSVLNLKSYGNTIASFILYFLNNNNGKIDDMKIITEYDNKKDAAILKKLNPKIKLLEQFRGSLLSTKVPSKVSTLHLSFINIVETYRFVLENLTKTDDDPVRGMIAMSNYQESVSNFLGSIQKYAEFFDKENVVFSNKEIGYLFTYYIINK